MIYQNFDPIGKRNIKATRSDLIGMVGADDYKQIAGLGHQMKTIIIVDTVSPGSDLLNKAARVDGIVLQMSHNDWVIEFAKAICEIFGMQHILCRLTPDGLEDYLEAEMQTIDIQSFIAG